MMLDETAKRKPNFDAANSVPVRLADGQDWQVPKPWLEVRPVFRGGRAERAYPVPTCGPELDALIDAVSESDEPAVWFSAIATLAARLLGYQYDLSDDDLDQLLRFRVSDPDSGQWLRDVMRIATGDTGPKAYRAGSG